MTSVTLGTCAAGELVSPRGSVEGLDSSAAGSRARMVASQGIRESAIDTLAPAALDRDGRLIAFVGRSASGSPHGCCQNVYVLDRSTGAISQESVGPDGAQPDGDSNAPSLSSDGTILAFETLASTFTGRRQGRLSIVVRNRQGRVWQTPANVERSEPNGETREPALSRNGAIVVFTSDATDLTHEPDVNGARLDVYQWRLDDSTIVRVSVDSSGAQSTAGASNGASVNGDGALIAFVSTAKLAPEDTNDAADVYLRDVRRGITSLVSRGIGGRAGNGPSHSPALSADGRWVVFASMADNLAPGDRNDDRDVFVYDVETRSIGLVSRTSSGIAANAASARPAISADGRRVAFQSLASNLGSASGCPPVIPDRNLLPDVYLLDRTSGCIARSSGNPEQEWWSPSVAPAIDAAGVVVTFSSTQPVSDEDVTTGFDLFLFERPR